MAQTPQSGKYIVGLDVDAFSYFGRMILLGIGRFIRAHGNWEIQGQPARIVQPIADWRRWRGHGAIVHLNHPHSTNGFLEMAARRRLPFVDIGRVFDRPDVPSVAVADYKIGLMVADYFIGRGYRRLAFCGQPGHQGCLERQRGFCDEAAKRKCTVSIFEQRSELHHDGGAEAPPEELRAWLGTLSPQTGVFGWHDGRARQIAEAAKAINRAIPEEISIVGCDDDEVACELYAPTLSSVSFRIDQVGYQAAELLQTLMDRRPTKSAATHIRIEPTSVTTRRSSEATAVESPAMAEALKMIRENRSKPLSVEDILERLAISRRSLEREFMRTIGRTPRQEIEHVHLERARLLLIETDWAIPRIATESGYASFEHFCVMFRRRVGIPPSRYRKLFRAKVA